MLCMIKRHSAHPADNVTSLPAGLRPLPAGFGNHLARPLMREKHRPDMSEEEATALMHECLKASVGRTAVKFVLG